MKNVNESGRSMVEMLGVLAIIGVLSIGGIAGYTLAMNRYRANEILNAASMVAIEAVARAATGAGADVLYTDLGGVSNPTGADSITGKTDGTVEVVILKDYKDVCDLVKTLSGNRASGDCGDAANSTITIDTKAATK